jgi:Spondin_N
MNLRRNRYWCHGLILTAASVALFGCGDNDSNSSPPPSVAPVMVEYEVSVVNLTAEQPLSPLAIVAHSDGYELFSIGLPATVGLENLAEGGSNAEILQEAQEEDSVITTVGGDAPVGPGGTDTLTVSVEEGDAGELMLSIVTMLVNTNDAITAARAIDVSTLGVDESITVETISYDSGTEANSEAAGTIPGPADSGEGFNETRDDISDQVTAHAGILSADDGLAGSVLTQQHRWDNPVARVRITRVQ